MTLSFSFLDFYDTTGEKLLVAGHVPGPKCCCKECNNLKDLEDRWILKMGSFYGISGLNSRDEIKNKTRCTWKWTSNFKSSICFLLLNVPIFSNRYWNFSLLFSFLYNCPLQMWPWRRTFVRNIVQKKMIKFCLVWENCYVFVNLVYIYIYV